MRLVCFAIPDSRRLREFAAACQEVPGLELRVVPWQDVIAGTWDRSLLRGKVMLRLESPGKDAEVERALLMAGAEEPDDEADGRWWHMTRRQVAQEKWEAGRIAPMRQWQLGWQKVLRELSEEAGPEARWFTPPDDVRCLFDKHECQQRLEAMGCPVPPSFGIPHEWFHLMEVTGRAGCQRFFLKSCHGSSASGVMAIEHGRQGMQAFTTVELVRGGPEPVMYNSRRVRCLKGDEVMETADAICRLRAMTQVWMPKAGWRRQRMDLRVVTTGGRATHFVPRLSRAPFTTLQLGAGRGDAAALCAEMGEEPWRCLTDAAERAAAAFPCATALGVDVLMTPGWSRAAVLEVNAFGDLLPGVLADGRGTYACQLATAGLS